MTQCHISRSAACEGDLSCLPPASVRLFPKKRRNVVLVHPALDSAPAVFRKNRASTIEALAQSGVDKYDIPAFLRKQAD